MESYLCGLIDRECPTSDSRLAPHRNFSPAAASTDALAQTMPHLDNVGAA